jgi:hypothetical protein
LAQALVLGLEKPSDLEKAQLSDPQLVQLSATVTEMLMVQLWGLA